MPTTALGAGGRWSPGLGWGCRFGRPTYITSGREEDLPGRSVAGMRTRTFSMLDAAYAAGVDPADPQEIRTLRTSVGGHSGAKFKPRGAMRGMSLPCVVRLSPRSYAIWAALSWTCLTAPRIIGVARWIDRLTRCPGP